MSGDEDPTKRPRTTSNDGDEAGPFEEGVSPSRRKTAAQRKPAVPSEKDASSEASGKAELDEGAQKDTGGVFPPSVPMTASTWAAIQAAANAATRNGLPSSSSQAAVRAALRNSLPSASTLAAIQVALRNSLPSASTLAAMNAAIKASAPDVVLEPATLRAMRELASQSQLIRGANAAIQAAIRSADLPYNSATLGAVRDLLEGTSTASTIRLLEQNGQAASTALEYFGSSPQDPVEQELESFSPGQYFSAKEGVVRSLEDLHVKVARLIKKNPHLEFVWRGHQNAEWGMTSKLFRVLTSKSKAGRNQYPSEEDMVAAEKRILMTARTEWRFDGMSAIEIFARLQHFGAPTRFLDVTRNMLVAAWFAVEGGSEEDSDGRLLALATGPVPRPGDVEDGQSRVSADLLVEGQYPIWHSWEDTPARAVAGWGTGRNRLVWIPRAYEERIAAQNAGFVLDGVPIISEESIDAFARPDGQVDRSGEDVLAAGSIYAKTFETNKTAQHSTPEFAPTFSFRIPAAAKEEIREQLRITYSLSRGTIYPDIAGLAQYLSRDFGVGLDQQV